LTIWESQFFRTTTTYIKLGEYCLLIDPNLTDQEIHSIKDDVHLHHHPEKVIIIYSHSDYDHIAGDPFFPKARKVGSHFFTDQLVQEKAIKELQEFDQINHQTRMHPYVFPKLDDLIHENGQKMNMGEYTIQFFYAPGHTKDSLLILIPELKIMIVGDYLSNIEIPFIEDGLERYLMTLSLFEKLIDQYNIDYLVSGHGDVAMNLAEMKSRILDGQKYLHELRVAQLVGSKMKLEKWKQKYPPPDNVINFHNHNINYLNAGQALKNNEEPF
jgi:glyoxylase-like metal-dependent hydrolase (beta-lactamase superfamily II)